MRERPTHTGRTRSQPRLPAGRQGGLLLTAALVAVLSGSWFLYQLEVGRITDAQRHREALRVNVMAQLLRSELRPVVETLRMLTDGARLGALVDTGSEAAREVATRRTEQVAANHPELQRLRFIDAAGRVQLRVDQNGSAAGAAPDEDLSTAEYFVAAARLPPNGLFLSAIQPDPEPPAAGEPARLVLRMAMPVFDGNGTRRGVYVVDYRMTELIGRLEQVVPSLAHRVRLLNATGHWIKGPDAVSEPGAWVPAEEGVTLASTHPDLWQRVQVEPSGQYGEPGDPPFTWLRLDARAMLGEQPGPVVTEEPFLVLATDVAANEWRALSDGLRQIMLLVVPGLVGLTLFCAWLIRGWRRTLLEVRAANQLLEERVRTRTAELARTNQELREHEELLEETGRLAHVGGWEFDPVTGEGAWTAEIARIHGLETDVKPSRAFGMQFFKPEDQKRIDAAIRESVEHGTPYDLELQMTSARGEHKWVRTMSHPVIRDGRVVRMRGAMQDITERKQTELRLQQQLQRLHLLERITRAIGARQDLPSILQVVAASLETQMPLQLGGVLLYEPPDDHFTMEAIGPAGAALDGSLALQPGNRVPIEANGLSRCIAGQLVHEPDLANVHSSLAVQLTGAGLHSLVVAPLWIEGMVFGVVLAARREPAAFSTGDCEFLGQLSEHVALAVHQARLNGALQSAYENLATTQQAAMQQDRLRVLGQMASGIAHDINNAISPIMLYTGSLLENEPGLSERGRNALATIQQAVSDVAGTVARLREFYRHRAGQAGLRPVPLNTVVAQVPDLTRARWQSMPQRQGVVIDLQLALDDALPAVNGIENEIREALVNLVFNAVDAMPGGGRLVLRTGRAGPDRVFAEVTDTGSGMDEETRRRCLEPFFTTKGERGTGLGLATVYGVMQRHEGAIDIRSAPGAGTAVRLLFNVAEAPVPPTTAIVAAPARGLHLLLVDDDPVLLRSLRETLQLDAHTILTAGDGHEGVELFRQSLLPGARKVSLVITDLGMPNLDGRAVAAAVKQAAPEVPVIMLTGWGERLLAEGQVVPNVDRVIGKPPRLHDLRLALAELTAARPS